MLYFLQSLFRVVLAVALVATALLFASVLLVVALATLLLIGGWVWWRTRYLRRPGGVVIEGEFRIERDQRRLDR